MIILQLSPDELSAQIKNSVREVLSESAKNNTSTSKDKIGGIELAEEITGLAKPTIYNLASRRAIPAMKQGKKLYFSEKELLEWIQSGKRKTIAEAEAAADQFLSKPKSVKA